MSRSYASFHGTPNCLFALILGTLCCSVSGQSLPPAVPEGVESIRREQEAVERLPRKREDLPEPQLREDVPPQLTLPPLPEGGSELSGQFKVQINQINVTGNTVFSDEALGEITGKYENREITTDELQALRYELTRHHVNSGYINSGAVIPDQEVENGVIEIQIIEGRLSEVELEGNTWLRDSYIKNRLLAKKEDTLNLNQLQERIQLLQQDRLVERVNAELRPGLQRGEGILAVLIEESRPYDLILSFNNESSPSVGGLQGQLYGTHHNVSGFGDAFGFHYGYSDGLDDFGASYSIPFTRYDSRLNLYSSRSDSEVIEEPFDQLDITSETEYYQITISHPFVRTPESHLIGSLTLEKRRSESTLLGIPFSFSPGTRNGKSAVSVIRLSQEWIDRALNQVIAVRSTFNLGVDALGATINNNNEPDSRFFSWLGQFQWVHRLGDTDNQILVRSDLQLAADPLLPLEKFGVGGSHSVRGYRENLFVRDSGWVSSVELRFPVDADPELGQVQLATFFDFAWTDNTDEPTPSPRTIFSPGIGVRWDPSRHLHGELYYGVALRSVDPGGEEDLQDDGFHFDLAISVF